MAKEIKWKPLNIKGLKDGDLGDPKHSLRYSTRQSSALQSELSKRAHSKPESKEKILSALSKGRANGACEKGGQTNVRTGHINALGKKYWKIGSDASLELIKCEVCGTESNTGNYAKWHGKKCQYKNVMALYDALPNEFTHKQAKLMTIELELPTNTSRKLILDRWQDLIEIIHEGTNGSSKDVPIYRKKS